MNRVKVLSLSEHLSLCFVPTCLSTCPTKGYSQRLRTELSSLSVNAKYPAHHLAHVQSIIPEDTARVKITH